MIKIFFRIHFFILIFVHQAIAQGNLDGAINKQLSDLLSTYKTIHAAPELSGHEENTSSMIASRLKALGYTVTENVGKFQNRPWRGYGVVGVMKNGNGPTVLIRTDMDALPVIEKTGL